MDPNDPATMLLPLAGILLILLAVWLTGGARAATLDEATIVRRVAEDLPGATIPDLTIGTDRRTALAALDGGIALVAAFVAGDKVVVRRLVPGDVRGVATEPHGATATLVIDTGDFTHRRLRLSLPLTDADAWEARAAALVPRATAA